MASVEDLGAALQAVCEALPYAAAEEFHTRVEAVAQRVTDAIRTSHDETELLGVIAHVQEEGTQQIRNTLHQLTELIMAAGSRW